LVSGGDSNNLDSPGHPYEKMSSEQMPFTGSHEYGHLVGLEYEDDNNNNISRNGIPMGPRNLMRSAIYYAPQYINKYQLSRVWQIINNYYNNKQQEENPRNEENQTDQ